MSEYDDKFFDIARISKNVETQRVSPLSEGRTVDGRQVGATNSYIVDGSDSLANQAKQIIEFVHVPSSKRTSFKAFISALNETYSCDWSEEPVYGRVDPIRMFKQNSRSLTLSFIVPAASESEGFENLGRIQSLISFLYPSYSNADNALTISQSPLIRLKVMNLIQQQRPDQADFGQYTHFIDEDGLAGFSAGLLGVIKNVTVNHNIDNPDIGVFATAPGVIIPKAVEISIDFSVIHETHLGWDEEGDFSSPVFPYGANIPVSTPATPNETRTLYSNATTTYNSDLANLREEQRKNQQLQAARDIARSHFLNANGDLNMWGSHVQGRLQETSDAASGRGSMFKFGIKDSQKAAYYAGAMAVIGTDGRLNENVTAEEVDRSMREASEDASTLSDMDYSWIR